MDGRVGEDAVKHVLMVAFHFPPYGMSSGVQRAACFARYLPRYGWTPLVLSASTRAYNAVAAEQEDYPGTLVRAFALDTVRHLGVAGKYPGSLALPDRWISWFPAAVLSGLKLIRKHRPRVIWSTYPIATAHLVGYALQRLTGLPWIADFRDPMLDEVHPTGGSKRRIYRWIEEKAVKYASICCFTTLGAMRAYQAYHPKLLGERCRVIANGFDEQDFVNLPLEKNASQTQSSKLRLLHSGALYPLERDPSCFFEALAILHKKGTICPGNIEIMLRATGHDGYIQQLIDQHGLEGIVNLLPSIDHHEALSEMLEVDGLLLLQAENCNQQIPAKTYEYLRSEKPIFAMTDQHGDTAELLQSVGIDAVVPLDNTEQISLQFGKYIQMLLKGEAPLFQTSEIEQLSREHKTVELVAILDDLGHQK